MLFERVVNDENLFFIRKFSLGENGVEVGIHEGLYADVDNDVLDSDRVCILKLDEYFAYNSRGVHNPPKVIDNLVVVKCCNGSVRIYLLELRDSRGRRPTRRLAPREIEEKFSTAADDFIGVRYRDIFDRMQISQIEAYLVTDPWGLAGGREDCRDVFEKKMKGSALDAYGSRKPLDVLNRKVLIQPVLPPNPVIAPC